MKKITDKIIKKFEEHLINEEKSKATIEKYIRDISAFASWLGCAESCKARVLEYKDRLIKKYAPSSVNSILSSLNSFFDYSGEYGLKVKNLKIQKQIFAKSGIRKAAESGKIKRQSQIESYYADDMRNRDKGQRVKIYLCRIS